MCRRDLHCICRQLSDFGQDWLRVPILQQCDRPTPDVQKISFEDQVMKVVPLWLILLAAILNGSATCSAQFGGGDTSVGYIDSAIVRNQIRFRFDASYNNPTPARAEFLYPKSSSTTTAAPPGPGPPLLETAIDFQEFSLYAESLLMDELISGFVEIPFRLIDPERNNNAAGISDLHLGLKAMLWSDSARYFTFQFRTYLPSGDGFDGLGTEHVSLEPGLLFLHRCSNGATIEGEVRDFIPINGSDGFAGNVLRYGLGVSQTWIEGDRVSVMPVFETVAWSVLSGSVLTGADTPNQRIEGAETTIVNMKMGTRIDFTPTCCSSGTKSLYLGYGRSLTGARWYQDTLRLEYRWSF